MKKSLRTNLRGDIAPDRRQREEATTRIVIVDSQTYSRSPGAMSGGPRTEISSCFRLRDPP